jgi:5'(3')-deoxyribonucleotidase
MNKKLSIAFDLDNVVLDSTVAIIQLHHELTGEIPKIHYSQTVKWNFEDIITADNSTINSYFEHPRFFEIVTFISDKKLSMKSLVEELIVSDDFEVSFASKGTETNHKYKIDWLTERVRGFKREMYNGICITENGKPNIKSDIFIDDCSVNFNGHAKYNVLFRKNGLKTEYNYFSLNSDAEVNSVTELANLIFTIYEFEKNTGLL